VARQSAVIRCRWRRGHTCTGRGIEAIVRRLAPGDEVMEDGQQPEEEKGRRLDEK
jgi:hypothetical protein